VSAAIARALEKLPADRFESAKAFAEALSNPAFARSATESGVAKMPGWHRYAGPLIIALTVVAVASTTLAVTGRPRDEAASVAMFSLAFPPSQGLTAPGGTRLAWSPDGKSFLYVGPGSSGAQLWRRSLDALEAAPIPGTDGATSPFYSPDGTRIGFINLNPFAIRVLSPAGGTTTLVVKDTVSGGGASWGDDGFIYFDGLTTLSRIRPDGTGREIVYALDSLQREVGVAWAEALPGGRGVLFRVRRIGDDISDFRILVVDLRTRRAKFLVQAAVARYARSGHILYVTSDGNLMASRFDIERLEMTGEPVALVRGLGLGAFGVADVAIGPTGSLLYTTDYRSTIAEPTWVTRDGSASPVDASWPDGLVYSVALSPDGSQVAVEFINANSTNSVPDIWTERLGGALSRLTFEGANNQRPRWSLDGRDILFVSDRGGLPAVYRQRADGSSPAQRVASDPRGLGEGFEAPDGGLVLRSADDACCDILGMRPAIDSAPRVLVGGTFRERSAALSPDGKWLAYASDEGGRFEVFVRPFPDVQSGRWQISTAGGEAPRWSRQGDELFYVDEANDMLAVKLATRPVFGVLQKTRLFSVNGYFSSPWAQAYDVTPDGKRFLMLRVGSSSGAVPVSLVLVQNVIAELQRKVP
jgi:serine/threonine-protein kinase